jgi:hypothetical protein
MHQKDNNFKVYSQFFDTEEEFEEPAFESRKNEGKRGRGFKEMRNLFS